MNRGGLYNIWVCGHVVVTQVSDLVFELLNIFQIIPLILFKHLHKLKQRSYLVAATSRWIFSVVPS